MDQLTGQIAAFANGLRFDDLGDDVVHAATQRLIDALGCALGAHDCEPAEIGRRLAAGQTAGKFAGRTLFKDAVLPVEIAGFINATMIRNFDFNDRFPGGHPSDGLGAHLALAGMGGIDGKRFLTAMVVTYEIFIRLSESSNMRHLGWDQGFAVALSATSGLCNLLGLSVEQTANAIGITATATVPLRVTRSGELTPWKNVATAFAARNGAFAAMLASEGMIGPGSSFEGRAGLFDNVTGPFEIAPFPTEGGEFKIPTTLLKYWPLETNGQPVVWAALEMREKIQLDDIGSIESIHVLCDEFTRFEIASEPEKWDPQTRETADHSLPYIFARALVDGPLNVGSFDEALVRDAALRPLLQKIKVTTDPAIEALLPEVMMVRVIAQMTDGTSYEVEISNPLGHPANPMQDTDIEEKFRAQAAPVLGADRCGDALAAWWKVGEAPDMRPLIEGLDI
jgi:2-methylcitrate dehydratase